MGRTSANHGISSTDLVRYVTSLVRYVTSLDAVVSQGCLAQVLERPNIHVTWLKLTFLKPQGAEAAGCKGVVTDVLEQVGLNKSLGVDGLPYKVYFRMLHMFFPILTDVFNHWFAQRAIPVSITKGVITLLKKGSRHVWEELDKSSSSSSLCRAISPDIPDPLSPPLPIVHYFRLVFRATSHISTELLYAGSNWSSCLCSSMWRGPQE